MKVFIYLLHRITEININLNSLDTYYYIYIVSFIGIFTFSFIVNKIIIVNSQSMGIKYKNDTAQRWSTTAKPSLGGVSLYASFMLSVPAYAFLMNDFSFFSSHEFWGLFVAANLAFFMGVYDDYSCTKPMLKLSVQILNGLIFILTGNGIVLFDNYIIDGIITIIWVVAVMNSLNMLDNMDGITATVSLFILLACATIFILSGAGSLIWLVLIIAQMGALVGFLAYNINPSKIFMGDGGSQFLALFVAFFGIKAIWNLPADFHLPTWTAPFLVVAAFTPTIADTLTVMINRRRRGVSVMLGGKDHTTHHLVYRGFSDFKVWFIFTIISAFSFLYAVQLSSLLMNGYYMLTILGGVFFFAIFIPLYRNTLKYKAPQN
ncbi:MAG TPA: MraY family glycosyltransferase [Brumimicrobium sp.]|nr:MraY family glycosyltransferase [Brumimicrobium sp.]